jgi:phage I-like protein
MKNDQQTSSSWPFALPVDGWYHLAPRGSFFGMDDLANEPVTQLMDEESFKAILADFNVQAAAENFGGILIDYDHFSSDPEKKSEAAGWITEIEIRADGLWFKPRWSQIGESNLKAGCYRFISPVFDGVYLDGKTVRPLRLVRAGLTNDPNFKTLRPLSNRAQDHMGDKVVGQLQQGKEQTMKKLLALLGLPETATEDEAITKLTALQESAGTVAELQNRATTAETELKQLKTTAVETEADGFCDTHAARIENRAAVRAQYIKDPEGTKTLFGGLKTKPDHVTLHNRAGKQPGQEKGGEAKTNADLLEAKVQEFRTSNRCSYAHAHDAVSRAHPELLKPETATE